MPTLSAAQNAGGDQVKAAYLYNFAKLVEWTARSSAADSPIVIGVFGSENGFVGTLRQTVSGKNAGTRPVTITSVNSPGELKLCQIAFFPASERKRSAAAIANLGDSDVLLVGEDDNFLREGG